MSFTFVDLFSGIGGFRQGLEANGGKCLAFSEIDNYASSAYKVLYDTSDELELGDITKVTENDLSSLVGKVDVLCGGFPCQAFSQNGTREGILDERGLLFWQIVRIARIIKPKVLFLENVKGLLSNKTSISQVEFLVLLANSLLDDNLVNNLNITKTHNKDLYNNLSVFLTRNNIKSVEDLGRLNDSLDLQCEYKPINTIKELLSTHIVDMQGFVPVVRDLLEADKQMLDENEYLLYCKRFIVHILLSLYSKQVKVLCRKENKGDYNVSTFGLIVSTLAKDGYNIEYGLCNSKNFGVPQNRERIYIVAHNGEECSRKLFHFS